VLSLVKTIVPALSNDRSAHLNDLKTVLAFVNALVNDLPTQFNDRARPRKRL
jgi:hypothetical protein